MPGLDGVPADECIDIHGDPYRIALIWRPCGTCNGTGKEVEWLSTGEYAGSEIRRESHYSGSECPDCMGGTVLVPHPDLTDKYQVWWCAEEGPTTDREDCESVITHYDDDRSRCGLRLVIPIGDPE